MCGEKYTCPHPLSTFEIQLLSHFSFSAYLLAHSIFISQEEVDQEQKLVKLQT